jgi:L-glutamine:2-deoxy-scyllo-inosose/3-amino-2,3-dideoxy-scyllo-inosose aminotransferase
MRVPSWPPVSEATAQRLADVYRSGKWSFNGEIEQAFAAAFAAHHDAAYGVFMANGTVTLECALAAYGIGPGDEVIVPALTWLATAMAAVYLGATPVFVDIEPPTLCLDPAKTEAAITPRTRAIIPVHLYGSNPDLDAIMAIAARHDLIVIEDCAHAHGGRWNGKGLGSIGHVGSFSFQQSKGLASGEGGICITNSAEIADRLFRLKHIGYGPGVSQGHAKDTPPPGLICRNYRGLEFQAVILRDQLQGLSQRIATYNASATKLEHLLADVPGLRVQTRGRLAGPQSYYAYAVIFDRPPLADVPLDLIVQAAGKEGLELWSTYGSVWKHALWNLPESAYRIAGDGCPVSDSIGTGHCALIPHWWLDTDDETLGQIVEVFARLSANADALRSYRPA